MANPISRRFRAALAACLLAATPATAYEIYTWVDEHGVVHYSESRPEEIAAPVETLYIEATNPPGYDPEDHYWSVANQAERIGADWAALQEEKAGDIAWQRAQDAERRLAELERQMAAYAPDYAMVRPVYGPFALGTRHPRFFNHSFRQRFHHGRDRRPPHHDRDRADPTAEPGPGWSAPQPPARPSTPGFRSTSP